MLTSRIVHDFIELRSADNLEDRLSSDVLRAAYFCASAQHLMERGIVYCDGVEHHDASSRHIFGKD